MILQRNNKQDIKKKLNNNRAITLIALVVTIVVLLILAGVSISMLTGEDGIIRQAQEAKENSKKSEIEEKVNLAAQAALMDRLNQGIEQGKFQEELDINFGSGVADLDYDESTKTYTVTVEDYEVKVDNEGQVSEAEKSSISIKLTLSYTEQIPTVGGNVAEIRDGNVPIPTGYTYKEGSRDTGLVIQDGSGNEFVWVPVNQNQKLTLDVTSKSNITGIKVVGPIGEETELISSGKTFSQEIPMTKNGVYMVEVTDGTTTKTAEKRITSLYAQDTEIDVIYGTHVTKNNASERYTTTQELLEAKSTAEKQYSTIDELLADASATSIGMFMISNGIFIDDQEEEFKKFVRKEIESLYIDSNQNTESVNKYGGYYIARYEAGDATTDTARTGSTADTNTLVSKKGAFVYNCVDVETSKTLATGLSNGSTAVTTQLITAAGWDRTLNWIIETGEKTENEVIIDSRSWGNYNNSTGNAATNSGSGNMNYTTGRSEYWKANNIYDLAGNTYEWTQEISGSSSVIRGGGFNSSGGDGPASVRDVNDPSNQDVNISFRAQLYINV